MSEPAVKFSFQNAAAFPQLPSRSVMIRWMTRACELPTMMTVRFVDQEEGYELNHSYRHRDYATNVLTFNYTTEPEVTADVAICVPVVEREAAEQNKEFRAHLAHLLIHAVRRKRLRSWRLAKPSSCSPSSSPIPTATASAWCTTDSDQVENKLFRQICPVPLNLPVRPWAVLFLTVLPPSSTKKSSTTGPTCSKCSARPAAAM